MVGADGSSVARVTQVVEDILVIRVLPRVVGPWTTSWATRRLFSPFPPPPPLLKQTTVFDVILYLHAIFKMSFEI